MAWTTPRTWIPGELVTASMLNIHLRDNMNALRATSVPTVIPLTDGATPALDASLAPVNGLYTLTAAGDRTIAVPTGPLDGQKIIIAHLASGGARTLTLNTGTGGFRFGTDITALTQTASGKTDYIGSIYRSSPNKWDIVAVAKGF